MILEKVSNICRSQRCLNFKKAFLDLPAVLAKKKNDRALIWGAENRHLQMDACRRPCEGSSLFWRCVSQ